jgi:cell division protein FtsL
MFRLTTILGVIFLSLCAFGLFQIKFKVQDLREDLTEIERQITEEQEALHILKAEWTYLTKSARIKTLANKYLNLNQINVAQIRQLQDINEYNVALASKETSKADQAELKQSLKTVVKWNYKENIIDRSRGHVIKAKL